MSSWSKTTRYTWARNPDWNVRKPWLSGYIYQIITSKYCTSKYYKSRYKIQRLQSCSIQTKSSWATTIAKKKDQSTPSPSPWRTSLPNLNRTRSPTATSCTASWFVAWNKKTIRSAWNQQVTACFFCLVFSRQAFSNFYGDIYPRVIEYLVGGFNPSEKY